MIHPKAAIHSKRSSLEVSRRTFHDSTPIPAWAASHRNNIGNVGRYLLLVAIMMSDLTSRIEVTIDNEVASMVMPFDSYPHGGQQLLGRRTGDNARWGYGLRLQRLTGQTSCAWCGVDLVGDYYRWLLLTVDHVVPTSEAKRLGIPLAFSEDYLNFVVACAGCNGFDNQYRSAHAPQEAWTLEEFVALRDAVFLERRLRIAERRDREQAFFDGRPWQLPVA